MDDARTLQQFLTEQHVYFLRYATYRYSDDYMNFFTNSQHVHIYDTRYTYDTRRIQVLTRLTRRYSMATYLPVLTHSLTHSLTRMYSIRTRYVQRLHNIIELFLSGFPFWVFPNRRTDEWTIHHIEKRCACSANYIPISHRTARALSTIRYYVLRRLYTNFFTNSQHVPVPVYIYDTRYTYETCAHSYTTINQLFFSTHPSSPV
jgi:hypothetical protein